MQCNSCHSSVCGQELGQDRGSTDMLSTWRATIWTYWENILLTYVLSHYQQVRLTPSTPQTSFLLAHLMWQIRSHFNLWTPAGSHLSWVSQAKLWPQPFIYALLYVYCFNNTRANVRLVSNEKAPDKYVSTFYNIGECVALWLCPESNTLCSKNPHLPIMPNAGVV